MAAGVADMAAMLQDVESVATLIVFMAGRMAALAADTVSGASSSVAGLEYLQDKAAKTYLEEKRMAAQAEVIAATMREVGAEATSAAYRLQPYLRLADCEETSTGGIRRQMRRP